MKLIFLAQQKFALRKQKKLVPISTFEDMKGIKFLWLILLGLIAFYLVNKYAFGSKNGNFKASLVELDSTLVSEIVFQLKSQEEIQLKKEGEDWIVSQSGKTMKAKKETVSAILDQICLIKAMEIVAKTQDKWIEFGVTEGLGTKVKVYENATLSESFIIGKFDLNPDSLNLTSYLRMEGEDEVYAVDGFLTEFFSQGFDAFRNPVLAEIDSEEILEIKLEMRDTSYLFSQNDFGQWQMDGVQIVDSVKMESYLKSFKTLSSLDFEENFDELSKEKFMVQNLILKVRNQIEPVSIRTYRDTISSKNYVLESSLNPGTYFSSDSLGLFKKVLLKPEDFLPAKKKN